MPANSGEQVDKPPRLGETQLAILGGVPAEPLDGGPVIPQRVLVADH
jgi:hypothetical protein